ncbi:MAG: lipoprotein [Acinetobacter johnsonii]
MKKVFLGLLAVALLSGCTSGQMSQAKITTSQFDNSKNVSAREMPALGKDKWHPSNVFFGARWTDRAPQLIVLEVKYMHEYQNLNKLSFNVDGEIFDAQKLNVLTDIERNQYYKASKAPYVITVEQAKKILNAKNAKFRITTLSGQYTDGAIVINSDKSMAFKSIENVVQNIPN